LRLGQEDGNAHSLGRVSSRAFSGTGRLAVLWKQARVMKRDAAVLVLVFLGVLVLGAGVAHGQSTAAIIGWGRTTEASAIFRHRTRTSSRLPLVGITAWV
jgi:hypothetical protein